MIISTICWIIPVVFTPTSLVLHWATRRSHTKDFPAEHVLLKTKYLLAKKFKEWIYTSLVSVKIFLNSIEYLIIQWVPLINAISCNPFIYIWIISSIVYIRWRLSVHKMLEAWKTLRNKGDSLKYLILFLLLFIQLLTFTFVTL